MASGIDKEVLKNLEVMAEANQSLKTGLESITSKVSNTLDTLEKGVDNILEKAAIDNSPLRLATQAASPGPVQKLEPINNATTEINQLSPSKLVQDATNITIEHINKPEPIDTGQPIDRAQKSTNETLKSTGKDITRTISTGVDKIVDIIDKTFSKIGSNSDKIQQIRESVKQVPKPKPTIKTPLDAINKSGRSQYKSAETEALENVFDVLSSRLPKKGVLSNIFNWLQNLKMGKTTDDKGGGLFDKLFGSWWKKVLGFFTGLYLLWKGLEGGPLGGAFKILGKWLVLSPLKLAQEIGEKAFKFITKVARVLLPESIVKFLDEALLGLSKMFKGVVQPLRKAFFGGIKGLLGTGAMKFALKLLGKGGLVALRAIPILGSLIDFGFAVMRFKKGDYVGGLIDLAAGIATFFPGPGTAISIGLNVLNMILDATGGGAEGRAESGINQSLGDLFTIGNFKKLLFLSPIGPLLAFGQGIMILAKGGSVTEALTKMAEWVPFLSPLLELLGLKGKDESLGDSIGGVVDGIKKIFNTTIDILFVQPFNWVKEILWPAIKDVGGTLKKYLIDTPVQWYNSAVEWLSGVFASIITAWRNFVGFMKKWFIEKPKEWYDKTVNWLTEQISGIYTAFDSAKIKLIDWFKGIPDAVWSAIKGPVEAITNGLGEAWESAKDNVTGYFKDIPGKLKSLVVGDSPGPVNDMVSGIGKAFKEASRRVHTAVTGLLGAGTSINTGLPKEMLQVFEQYKQQVIDLQQKAVAANQRALDSVEDTDFAGYVADGLRELKAEGLKPINIVVGDEFKEIGRKIDRTNELLGGMIGGPPVIPNLLNAINNSIVGLQTGTASDTFRFETSDAGTGQMTPMSFGENPQAVE